MINKYNNSFIFKLIYNDVIIHFGASYNNVISKILFKEKQKIKNKKHNDKNLIKFFENDNNKINDIQIFLISRIPCHDKNELNKMLYDYNENNKHLLFCEIKFCKICNCKIEKNKFNEHCLIIHKNIDEIEKFYNIFTDIINNNQLIEV